MNQIIFSDQSMGEVRKLDSITLSLLIDQLSAAAKEIFKGTSNDLPKVQRGKSTFYRLKIGTLRTYLAKKGKDTLICQYIIPQHTLTDFIFRSNLPISDEQMVEQHSSFWKYVDSLKNK